MGVPKTIDNDLAGTDFTFGYDTACGVVAESVDALRATANAHRRVIVVETMGRTAGWIALGGGIASYADAILIPEKPFSREGFKKFLLDKKSGGQRGLVIVVSEGAFAQNEEPVVAFEVKDSPEKERLGGIGQGLARWIEKEIAWEARHVVLGHLQRSHAPTTTDRFMTLTMGVEITRMLLDGAWGKAVVFRSGRVQRGDLQDLMQAPRRIPGDHPWIRNAELMGIYV
jgi:6-phosphofructokinase 1